MTKEKLSELIELKHTIEQYERSYEDICSSRRELELDEYRIKGFTVSVQIDRKRCEVDFNRIVEFLNNEADILKIKLKELKSEFKNK